MVKPTRLFQLSQILEDGAVHRAEDLARSLNVSVRTIYRDLDKISAAGMPLRGTRGSGYTMAQAIALPPLTLSEPELEALSLGLAVVAQAADDDTRAAAASLSAKIDAATTAQSPPQEDVWRYAASPFADATRNLAHMPLLRAAIRARQKVGLIYTGPDGDVRKRVIRPLKLAYWGHVWALTAWCDTRDTFDLLRLDQMENLEALPELFVDEPGKRLADYQP